MVKIRAEHDDVALVTAREFLAQAFEHAAEAAGRDGELETYHENREILSLLYSAAMSLADIADALRPEIRTETQVAPAPGAPAPAVYDGDGDRWLNFPGTDRYALTVSGSGRTLDEIRGAYGLRD